MCTCMWKSKVNVRCLLPLFSSLTGGLSRQLGQMFHIFASQKSQDGRWAAMAAWHLSGHQGPKLQLSCSCCKFFILCALPQLSEQISSFLFFPSFSLKRWFLLPLDIQKQDFWIISCSDFNFLKFLCFPYWLQQPTFPSVCTDSLLSIHTCFLHLPVFLKQLFQQV